MLSNKPEILLKFVRDGLVEQFHTGFVLKMNSNGSIFKIGEDFDYPYFLRSCAKPLQSSLLIDLQVDKKYNLSSEEIAVCCASHAGENVHLDVIKSLMKKFDLTEDMYRCGLHEPLSKTKQKEMLLKNEPLSVLHNNCSGKHTMMLSICKVMGYDFTKYDDLKHPVQKSIQERINDLCEIKTAYPISTDGCGVPIFSMPLSNMLVGYKNLFFNKKYEAIKNAFLDNYYIIGGEDRLDSAIISSNDSLVAKVGAGGLCIVCNTKTEEVLLVKISDSDMKTRAIVTIEALKQLGWLKNENEFLEQQNSKKITTLQGKVVGSAEVTFDISKS